jgi:fumarate hydratase, class I
MSEAVARSLELGELVTLNGRIFTGRSRFHIRAIENDIVPDIDFASTNCFFHVGPVMRKTEQDWDVVSIEPTSSIRFEKYGADVVRKFGLRTLVGKTTMGPATAKALKEIGGVYLSKIGICGNQLRQQITKTHAVFFLEELGKTEATWVFTVENFGPFFVAIDSHGENYFDQIADDSADAMKIALADIGVPEDFAYTDLSPRSIPGPKPGGIDV